MILKADLIWSGRGKTIRNGGIRIRDGHVVQIAPFDQLITEAERVIDMGRVILLPAMINAHTHLDLSHLEGRFAKGVEFPQWLKRMARARIVQLFESRSIRKGIRQTIEGGAVAVGDVSTSGRSAFLLKKEDLDKSVVFCEAMGLDPAKAGQTAGRLRTRVERLLRKATVRVGIAPHAPYSVSPELFQKCVALAREYSLPLAIHTAEVESEAALLTEGTGELRTLLDHYGLLPPGWKPPGLTPVRYLQSLGVLEARPLLVHCNHIDEGEAAIMAKTGCSAAYCPRSNAFFRRTASSIEMLLAAGVNVALGTDSLASNDTLSMLDEAIFVRQRHPALEWETIFEMATVNAARALGIDQGGLLAERLPANIAAITLPRSCEPADMPALDESSIVAATFIHGRSIIAGKYPFQTPLAKEYMETR